MLRAIHIKRFGLFEELTFALDPVTVFGGANQSGKSTLFDAIRIFAFHPERRSKEHRALYARYGDEVDVRLDWQGEPPEMTDEEFMNLFAVSAGDLSVNLAGDWLNAVKKNLFAGGIDPRNLIEHFGEKASEKRTLAHMRERTRLEKERDAGEARLETVTAQRDEILAQLDRQETARGELKGLIARLAVLAGEAEALGAEVGWQARIAERVRQERHLALLEQIAALEEAQRGRQDFAVDRTEELDALEQALAERERERTRAEDALQRERSALAALQAASERAVREQEHRAGWEEGLTALEARVAAFEDGDLTRKLVRGTLAALLLLSGAAAVIATGGRPWAWIVLAGGSALAIALFTALPWLDEWRLLRSLKDLWRGRLVGTVGLEPAQSVLDSRTLTGVTAALARVRVDLERVRAEREETARAVRVQQQSLAGLEGEAQTARGAAERARAALRDWLAALQVESRDAYRDRLNAFRTDHATLNACYGQLKKVLGEQGLGEAHQLRVEAERRLKGLLDEGVPNEGLPEPEARAQQERLAALREEIAALEAERHDKDRHAHGTAERLVGRLGTLPEEIAALGDSLRRCETGLATLEFDRRAAERALGLFHQVSTDESTVLAELSGAVAGVFGRLSGLEETRQATVALAGLSEEEIRALDRQGHARPVTHLSSGARGLLYLALRLEMARRERQGRFALLCLDEPFAFLDPERQLETLQYLREFLEQTGWQLILFTNEPAQADRVKAIFPNCRRYDL